LPNSTSCTAHIKADNKTEFLFGYMLFHTLTRGSKESYLTPLLLGVT